MRKLFAAVLALVMCLALVSCGGGGSSDGGSDSGSGGGSSAAEMIGEYYQFDIDGQEYALPCAITDITDKGWFIYDEDLNYELDPHTSIAVYVYTNGTDMVRAFTLDAANLTDEKMKISECTATRFAVSKNDTCCNSVTLKKSGVKIDLSSYEKATETCAALKSAYGTDEGLYTEYNEEGKFNSSWILSMLVPEEERDDNFIGASESTEIFGVAATEEFEEDARFELNFAGFVK